MLRRVVLCLLLACVDQTFTRSLRAPPHPCASSRTRTWAATLRPAE